MKRGRIYNAAFLPVFLFAMIFGAQDGQAVRLSLKRVVFEGAQRADVMTLVNDSAEEQTYRLSWRDMKMTAEQPLAEVPEGTTDPAIKPARDLVIFAPRRVTLPPGGSQQIRLMLKKPADLPEGEYRSHLLVTPEKEAVRFDPSVAEGGDATSIALKMLAGVSFPVIVRQGNLPVAARVTIWR